MSGGVERPVNPQSPVASPIVLSDVPIEPEFAEAFDMKATRLIVTADDRYWVGEAVRTMTGFGTSVIACEVEIAAERHLERGETPDGRVGTAVLAYATSGDAMQRQIATRVGQCVLTCPTASVFAGLERDGTDPSKNIAIGKNVRFFGDGFQISKRVAGRHLWRVPVMDGEFVCEHDAPRVNGVGGGNFILIGRCRHTVLAACRAAHDAIASLPDVIMPFPGGAARSGSKVGSKYAALFASTNDAFCPSLRGLVASKLADDESTALEIVIDGLTADAVARATAVGIRAAAATVVDGDRLTRITAGNYGGKLGRHHFHLHEVLTQFPSDAS